MSDPYNSYGSSLPPPAPNATVTPTIPRDVISKLRVSESWKQKFRIIEKAGGPDLPNFRDLPFGERLSINLNFLALLFGPIYYIVKGLWRQAVSYFIFAFIAILFLEVLGLGKFTRGIGTAAGMVYALRANISYYKIVVLREKPWL